jgi:DNA-binding MarR family transcriptional regulator
VSRSNHRNSGISRKIQPTIAPENDSTRRVTEKEYEKLAAFRYNLRQFLRFSEVAARSTGLTSQQHQALLAIKGFPDGKAITIGQLAEQLQVAHHSAVELIDRLALLDLVFREASTMDRRHVFVKLTDRGVEILETLTWAHREEPRQLATRLNSLF